MKRIERQKKRTDRDWNDEVPLYRSYGVRRKVFPWVERFKLYLVRALLIFIFVFPILCGVFALLMMAVYVPGVLFRSLMILFYGFLLGFWLTRTLRKRLWFVCKLGRFCKKQEFSLQYEQNFFRSFVWSSDRPDFVLKTKDCVYYVRYLTVWRYRTTLFLEKEDELRLVKAPLNNIVSFVFDLRPKVKRYVLNFELSSPIYDVPIRNVLVVNPVCQEIKYKLEKGGYEVTGSGGEHFGFTIYTGNGFLNALERDHR